MEIGRQNVHINNEYTIGNLLNKGGGRKVEGRLIFEDTVMVFDKKTYCLLCKASTPNGRGFRIREMNSVSVETNCQDCDSKKCVFQSRDKLPLNIQRHIR